MAELLSRREESLALRLAGTQQESAREFTQLLERIRERVVAAALAEEPVRRRLDGVRHRIVAVDYREDKPARDGGPVDRPDRLAEVVAYDYDRDILVIAAMHLGEGTLAELYERPGYPPITAEELDEARRILAEVPELAHAFGADGAQVVAFPTPSYAFDGQRDRHRGCTVFVGVPDGGTLMATVDLSAGAIVPDEELPPELLRLRRGRRDRAE
jgi:hypothetical protein